MNIEWDKHASKFVDRLTEILAGAFGAGVYHFLTEKTKTDGTPIVGPDGKTIHTLDMTKIRGEAPHFAKMAMDEAEFIAIKNGLRPNLITSLEAWMPTLGIHQRADVILTVSEMTLRKDLSSGPFKNRKMARDAAFKALEQLAEVPNVISSHARSPWTAKDAHAVAFRFMKANESEYLGVRLSAQAQAALVAVIAEVRRAKQDWDNWTNARAAEMEAWTRNMRTHLNTRPRGFFPTLRRLLDLPWERN